ncbi:MAG: hypothetical protein WBW61_09040 [Rhodanobacteraceae bacterium]
MPYSNFARRLRRVACFIGAALLAMICASATGEVEPVAAPLPDQVTTVADNIRPAMDLLLAPLDRIFANGFE